MRVIKQLLLLYFVYVATFVVIAKFFGSNTAILLKYPGLWIVPLVFISAGLLIGLVAALIIGEPTKNVRVFKTCSAVVFIIFALILCSVRFSEWKREKDFGNIESNEDYLKYLVVGYEAQVNIAFDSLSKRIGDANSFRLTGHHVQEKDTTLNGSRMKSYFIDLRYLRNNDDRKYEAVIAFIDEKVRVISFDKLQDSVDRALVDSINQIGEKTIRDLKKLPDSTKNRLGDDFKKLTDQ